MRPLGGADPAKAPRSRSHDREAPLVRRFTLSLTINIAQNRYEARRSLVMQEANSVQAACCDRS